jgi:hypothetical protein
VSFAADDANVEAVHGGHDRAGLHTNRSFRARRPQVAAYGVIDLGILHDAFFDHGLCPSGSLFSRLENELDVPLERLFHSAENKGCAEDHGHVRIVAARMHGACVGG